MDGFDQIAPVLGGSPAGNPFHFFHRVPFAAAELLLEHQTPVVFQFADADNFAASVCLGRTGRRFRRVGDSHQFQFGPHFTTNLELADTSGRRLDVPQWTDRTYAPFAATFEHGYGLHGLILFFAFRVFFHVERIPFNAVVRRCILLRLRRKSMKLNIILKLQMNFAYLPPLILLQFKFKKASGQRDGRVVIGARRRPSPLADADRFGPSVGIHQMMRGVRISENRLWRQRRRWRRRSPLVVKKKQPKNISGLMSCGSSTPADSLYLENSRFVTLAQLACMFGCAVRLYVRVRNKKKETSAIDHPQQLCNM